MIKLIVGTKGSGKTKAMIDQINDAVKTSKGNVVVVEKGMKLTYDIAPAARLIDLDEYKISGGEMLYGFVAGLMASNYDITDLYIDGILKVLDHDINRLGVVLDEMAAIAGDSVKVTVTVSADEAALPHDVKKYLKSDKRTGLKACPTGRRPEKNKFFRFSACFGVDKGLLWRYTNKAAFSEVYYAI